MSEKCFYEYHIEHLTNPASGQVADQYFSGKATTIESLFYSPSAAYLGSAKVTLEDFLYYSGHDFPSLPIAGIPIEQTSWRLSLKKIKERTFFLQNSL